MLLRRRELFKRKLLPPGYTQYKWLQNTTASTSAYLNPGININTGLTFSWEMTWQIVSTSTSAHFCGYYYTTSTRYTPYTSGTMVIKMACGGGDIALTNTSVVAGDLVKVSMTGTSVQSWVNGTLDLSASISSSKHGGTVSYPFYLFACLGSGWSSEGGTSERYKVYHFSCTNGSNQSCNLYPCTRNSDGYKGMYDLISNTFKAVSNQSYFTVGNS